ncbi:MAG: zinc-binding dehydrogenase [Chloroflexota bacterium]|nr:zinc-binding dehydrogenase [Chloroflexota bacterium]
MPKMLAALYNGLDTVEIKRIERLEPGPGDALVRVRAEGICGSDLNQYRKLTEPETLPAGHETAGEIVEVGEGVDPARIGQRVAVEVVGHGKACLTCWYCRQGQYRNCADKGDYEGGGFAEYVTRNAVACYPLGDTMTWEEGALVEPLAVSIRGMRRGGLIAGDTVVVLGAGNIGLTAIATARALGAGTIIATARHAQQADLAKRFGADVVLDPDSADATEAVKDLTTGRGADITVETVGGFGSNATLVQAVDMTRVMGRIVVLGVFHDPIPTDWMEPLLKEQSFIFSVCYGIMDGRHDFEMAIDFMGSGRIDLKPMVTHTYPLTEMPQALATAYDKSTGSVKVQLRM